MALGIALKTDEVIEFSDERFRKKPKRSRPTVVVGHGATDGMGRLGTC